MDILGVLTAELGVKMSQVEAAVKLIDEGNTIPFIARYRKEVTGSLNDEVLRNLDERLKYLRGLEDRKTQILASIEDRGSRDYGGGGGLIPAVPPEEKDKSQHGEGERLGAAGRYDPAAGDKRTD